MFIDLIVGGTYVACVTRLRLLVLSLVVQFCDEVDVPGDEQS